MSTSYGQILVLTSGSRYTACILNASKSPWYREVGKDVVDALLKARAEDGSPAQYWSKEEQVEKMDAMFNKWQEHGGVWSAAALKVSR